MLYRALLQILWVVYRLSLTLKFFLKYFLFFKFSSIFYDYYLGYYPKIFNDQGFYYLFNYLFNYLNNYFILYYFEIFFLIFFLIFYLYIFWPRFFETRFIREHLELKDVFTHNSSSLTDLRELEFKKIELKLDKLLGKNNNSLNEKLILLKKYKKVSKLNKKIK